MADTQPNPAPMKRALPFKRTIKRKSSTETPSNDDDGLSLFQHSKNFFPRVIEDNQARLAQEAKEKAAKEEEERDKRLQREREEEQEALQAQISREEAESAKKKRKLAAPPSDDEDDVFSDVSSKRKGKTLDTPSPTPVTPNLRSGRDKSTRSSTRGSGTGRFTRSAKLPVYTLDDSDDDAVDVKPSLESLQSEPRRPEATVINDDSDSDLEVFKSTPSDSGELDDGDKYVQAAMARMEKAKADRLAREQYGANTQLDHGPKVFILMISDIPNTKQFCFKYGLRQSLRVAFDTWKEQQLKILPHLRPVFQDIIFTWKGNMLAETTSLETLGIKADREGNLYSSWRSESSQSEGYRDSNKVLIEAWTKDAYSEFLEQREKERQKELNGDYESEEEAQEPEPVEEEVNDRVRVVLKARDRPPQRAQVRTHTTAAMLVKVYRKMGKIPDDQTIELRCDGQVLDPETTIEEADIEDLDVVEVYIK
ncbi:hypothetical protein F5Y15DRAFT_189279 [Xylariaceae sp. FL0016]|nr:hypothetical protein F5Y15DRAFT_189279 [Xylariaceae sp. FL0016]